MVRTWCFHCLDLGLIPGPQTQIPQAIQHRQKKKKKRRHNNKNGVGMCVLKIKEKGHDPWKADSCKMLKKARSLLKEDSSANTFVLVL